jgi:hypothetical protein
MIHDIEYLSVLMNVIPIYILLSIYSAINTILLTGYILQITEELSW